MSQYVKKIRTESGDLQIDYNALANLPTHSNPNLLINSNFVAPVNQRDIKTYIGGAEKGYTIDRWCMGNNDFERTVTLVDGGIYISNPNTEYSGTFQQIFEHTLPQSDYTLSIKVISKSGGASMSCGGSHNTIRKELEVGINTLTLTSATVSSFVVLLAPSSNITLEWAKLESGAIATPYVPRHYGEELALCRRYYRKYFNGYFIGLAVVTAESIVFAEQQEPMRINEPTLRITGTSTFNPLVQHVDKFVNLTSGYAMCSQHQQFISFDIGTATTGEIGRIYGEFELDAEIY